MALGTVLSLLETVNSMRQLDGATGRLDIWSNVILSEINI